MFAKWRWRLRTLRRALSRTEWSARILSLPRQRVGDGARRGLILVQIDGLARPQFERALANGRMPFLQRLLKHDGYRLRSHYSGLPSSTPAVQGEIFYGVKAAVPAFSFRDSATGRVFSMLDKEAAAEMERRLSQMGDPLLKGGTAYSNIYTGGAEEAHFCASQFGVDDIAKGKNLMAMASVALAHAYIMLRIAMLFAIELTLAVVDFFRGAFKRQSFRQELFFIPARLGITILLRELVTLGARMDAVRGMPIIQLNLLGYDEQAHRRGPSSAFAHWTLSGIDNAIKRIWLSGNRSNLRDYELWVYSDHGQEDTIPYGSIAGRSIGAAVAEFLAQKGILTQGHASPVRGVELERAAWLGGRRVQKIMRPPRDPATENGGFYVAAKGPTGIVYLPTQLDLPTRESLAREMVEALRIPIVAVADGNGGAKAFTPRGAFTLPTDAAAILGSDHPFLEEAATDLVAVVNHQDGGSFWLGGYRPYGRPLSFPIESGAHAGPGAQETHGFALLPADAPVPRTGKTYMRPTDLRNAVLEFMHRGPALTQPLFAAVREPDDKTLRIMTYNVHGCLGMDGQLTPERIARVIAQYEPDVVALQELDVNRTRSGGHDQAMILARELEMDYHFHPAFQVAEEKYGDAVLSRFPMRLRKAGGIPTPPRLEPRGAIWVEIEFEGTRIHFINTHFGLSGRERLEQARALLGCDWVEHPDCAQPLIVCGDFNALPRTACYRELSSRLRDVQRGLDDHKPKGTLLGVGRIDHVFISPGLEIQNVEIARGHLARISSDHLPLIVDLKLGA